MREMALTGLLLILTACGPKQTGTYEVGETTGSADSAAGLKAEADALWEQRADKAKLQAALAKYEQVYAADPRDRDVVVKLTRGWYFLGDAYEAEDAARLAAWDTAVSWGKRCMALNGEFTALLQKGDEDEASAVRVATVDDVPCMYWMASALGKWAKLNGIAKSLKHLPTVKAYIARVGELQPDYFYAASDRYWGAYYAAIPSFAGQDLDKSKSYFEKSIAASPDYLGTQVLLADYWAVKTQNRQVFEDTLKAVLEADPGAVPDIAAENQAEQDKARRLLEQADDLFR